MEDYGFIITRHVISEKTNKYWNQSVKLIRSIYPLKKIIIIDDNSDQDFVKSDHNYKNTTIIKSQYPKRGELLPFIYFLKNKWFNNAVIIHDSVFIHKKINFGRIKMPVLPIWHFPDHDDNPDNTNRILKGLKNNTKLLEMLNVGGDFIMSFSGNKTNKWYGVFGCQCFINHDFLVKIQKKYNIENLLNYVSCRTDRCSLERIFALIFHEENPMLKNVRSLFGGIQTYLRWGYNYDEYHNDLFVKKRVPKGWIKVWTGR
jgi:hypothetical protein